jgi:hypothetical protein
MDNANEMNLVITALQAYARRTHRVNMFRIVDQLIEVLVEGFRFGDIMQGFADYAESERDRTGRLQEEDKQLAWGTVASLLKATAQEAKGEYLP